MTTSSRPIADYLTTPCWLDAAPDFWWPCGLLTIDTAEGPAEMVLVLVAGQEVQLLAVQPQSTIPAKDGSYPHPREAKREPVRIAAELADAILAGKPFEIGYQGTKDTEERTRRVDGVAPGRKGSSVYATDLDKDAKRQFRLDRIGWVRAGGAS